MIAIPPQLEILIWGLAYANEYLFFHDTLANERLQEVAYLEGDMAAMGEAAKGLPAAAGDGTDRGFAAGDICLTLAGGD